MEIRIKKLLEGAKKAEGLTVIIDVFRAFSVTCYIFNQGAKQIISVGDLKKAYEIKSNNKAFVLVGERDGKFLKGFDYNNSPSQIKNENLTGKTIIHTTSAGTQGIVNAKKAKEVITGSFVNAGAIVRYIKRKNPPQITLVSMGDSGLRENQEDNLCAEYLQNRIQGKRVNFLEIRGFLQKAAGKRFFDPKNETPELDFDLCLNLDRFDFVIKAEKIENEFAFLRTIKDDKNLKSY